MTEYKWVINSIKTAPSENELTDVVKSIEWAYQATGGDFESSVSGALYLDTPSETNFTAYSDLTEDQVISWLETAMDVDALKFSVDAQIEIQKNPSIVSLPLPFAKKVI